MARKLGNLRQLKMVQPLTKKEGERLKKKVKSRLDGRWVIVALFLATLVASLFFYLTAEVSSLKQKFFSPQVVISKLPPEMEVKQQKAIDQIKEKTQGLAGEYGVYIYPLEKGFSYGFNQEKIFPVASLNKLPLMIVLYQQAEKGEIDLGTEYTLQEADKAEGAGILQSKSTGTTYTYRQLIEFMARHSDNTAFRIMLQVVDERLIDEATPKETGLLFKKLYQDQVISDEHRNELLWFLTKTAFEDRIPRGIPGDIRVAHKVGTLPGAYSDAGIIFADQPFVLVIMSRNAKEQEALEALVEITKIVWEAEKN